ncbi:MAG: hypothetical protein U5K00_13485 [Melioribacteraceae bacterium]|nr:hypothetical protein [Melioribacteraceae bacterium]
MSIRILHVLKSFDIGGAERSTIEYSNKLVRFCDYTGIVRTTSFFNNNDYIDKKIEVINIDPPKLFIPWTHIICFQKMVNNN